MRDARAGLLDLAVAGDPTTVSPRARAHLVTLRARVAELVAAHLVCAPESTADPRALSATLHTLVGAQADRAAEGSDGLRWGERLDFTATVAPDRPHLLAVTAALSIPCGSDALLLVFERTARGWHQALAFDSGRLKTIGDAFWSFEARISPPSTDGRWFVLTKHVSPWCSSTWSAIGYELLRPAAGGAPRVLLRRSESMWWGGDDLGRISIGPDHAEIRFHGASVDPGQHNRERVRRFSVRGDRVARTPPWASNARDFVEEWITTPWSESAAWSVRPGHPTRSEHDAVARSVGVAGASHTTIAECPKLGRVQLGLSMEEDDREYFFLVRPSPLAVEEVRTTASPDCTVSQSTAQPATGP